MPHTLFAYLASRYDPQFKVTRRRFLKNAVTASAGFLISGAHALGQKPRIKQSARRVIIVGGGLSGLACAYELMHAGSHVVLLEARNRLGGRVLTFHDLAKGKSVEGGGEYIGKNHPTWLAYARKFGLKLFAGSEDENADQPVILGGRRLDDKQAKSLFEEMKVVNKLMTADAVNVDADEPWKSPKAGELDRLNTARWLRGVSATRLCKLAFASQLAANNGAALAQQSYLGNLAQVKGGGLEKYWTDSEIYRCRGGNERLALEFGRALGERLRLKTAVTKIDTKDEHVRVYCANGEIVEGDDVVLAVPPSVWPRIRFEPDLPHALRPQMGVVVKYLSVVDHRFWQNEHLGPNAATDGMVSMTWDATEGQNGGEAVLLAFSGGPAAARCRERWSQSGESAYQQELAGIYPEYGKHFIKSRFMDWPADQWTRAGYSFPAPGQVTGMGSILRSGIGRLHFAGEHACYKFVGYMEGALDSGVSVAKRLALNVAEHA